MAGKDCKIQEPENLSILNMTLEQQTSRNRVLFGWEDAMKLVFSCLAKVSAYSQDTLSLGKEAERV